MALVVHRQVRNLPLSSRNGLVLVLRTPEFVFQRAVALEVGREVG
jgi:hypothetical protein